MSDESPQNARVWQAPLLCTMAILILLGMLRLGVWQLDRAEQKRDIVAQLEFRASQDTATLVSMVSNQNTDDLRFRKVSIRGRYLVENDLFVDNQVVNGQVGYQVFTPFRVSASGLIILVARGWVSVGSSRDVLPTVLTNTTQLALRGRLNKPPAKPPLWNDEYPASNGAVWQYLPIVEVANVLEAQVFPLVVELAPDASDSSALLRKWPEISNQWVAKHQGYAFQWFAMAAAFFIACLVLIVKSTRKS